VDVAVLESQLELAALLVQRHLSRPGEDHQGAFDIRAIGDHDAEQSVVVLTLLDVQQSIADIAEAPGLDGGAAQEHPRHRGPHLAMRGRSCFQCEIPGEGGEKQAQREGGQGDGRDADAARPHRHELGVRGHAPDRQQYAEEEGNRQGVDQQLRAKQTQQGQQVREEEARTDQLVQHAYQISRGQDHRDGGQAQQRVLNHLSRDVERKGARGSHRTICYPAGATSRTRSARLRLCVAAGQRGARRPG
jgi:hypothetical protein